MVTQILSLLNSVTINEYWQEFCNSNGAERGSATPFASRRRLGKRHVDPKRFKVNLNLSLTI